MLDELNERGAGKLPGLIGLEVPRGCDEVSLVMRLELREGLLAPDGYLHAGDPLLRLTPNVRVILWRPKAGLLRPGS